MMELVEGQGRYGVIILYERRRESKEDEESEISASVVMTDRKPSTIAHVMTISSDGLLNSSYIRVHFEYF